MKKKCFTAIITILLAIISISLLKARFRSDSSEMLLVNAFKSSGAAIVSSEVYFRGKIDRVEKASLKELEKIGSELAAGLGCAGDKLIINSINNEELEGVEISGNSDSNLIISISAVKSKNRIYNDNSYITASIIDKDGIQDIGILKRKVFSILGRYGISAGINSCITGSYSGKLKNDQLNDICVEIFKSADATKVEGMSENNLISVSAYTPSIGQAVEVNGKKVNLNLAIRYNSYEDKTYIWLATPVITTEY